MRHIKNRFYNRRYSGQALVEFVITMPLILGMIFLMAHAHQVMWSSQKLASCLWYAIRGNSYPAWAGPANDIEGDITSVFPSNYDVEVSYGLGFDLIAANSIIATMANPFNPTVPIYGRVSIKFESPYASFPFGLSGKSVGAIAFGDKIALSDDGVFLSTVISRSLAATSLEEVFADQFLGFFAEIPQHFANFFANMGAVEVDASMAGEREAAYQESRENSGNGGDSESQREEAEQARENAETSSQNAQEEMDQMASENSNVGSEEDQQFNNLQGQTSSANGAGQSSVDQMLNS